ncbi:MAG: N-acetyltransferase [Lachnospiraceae bacterium]|nr:N-acetyltransferase [Lachnospiraceae bacterium]
MTIRIADNLDLESIMEIYSYAREQMKRSGNPTQWGNDRPAPETILEDIRRKQAYVIVEQNRICGVFVFFTGIEPTYRLIENGAWLNDASYGTIHRIAGNGQVKGILAEALSFCEKQIDNIRVDTHDDNKIMQHLLARYGYQKCGYIYVEDGSRRIAYQKVVGTSSGLHSECTHDFSVD